MSAAVSFATIAHHRLVRIAHDFANASAAEVWRREMQNLSLNERQRVLVESRMNECKRRRDGCGFCEGE